MIDNTCDHAELAASTRNAQPLVQEDWHTVYPNLTGQEYDTFSTKEEYGSVDQY